MKAWFFSVDVNGNRKDLLPNDNLAFEAAAKEGPLIMIGDAGFGGYGGIWKQNIQGGNNTHVRCTSEYMTSQTCMYCFSKLQEETLLGKRLMRFFG